MEINSINKTARIGGILYLIIIITGIFGEAFLRDTLIVSGDPTATANNIMASPLLWRIGIAGDIIMHVCDVPSMMRLCCIIALIFILVLAKS